MACWIRQVNHHRPTTPFLLPDNSSCNEVVAGERALTSKPLETTNLSCESTSMMIKDGRSFASAAKGWRAEGYVDVLSEEFDS